MNGDGLHKDAYIIQVSKPNKVGLPYKDDKLLMKRRMRDTLRTIPLEMDTSQIMVGFSKPRQTKDFDEKDEEGQYHFIKPYMLINEAG